MKHGRYERNVLSPTMLPSSVPPDHSLSTEAEDVACMVVCRITTLIYSVELSRICYNSLVIIEEKETIAALKQKALSLYAKKVDTDAALLEVRYLSTINAGYQAIIADENAAVGDVLGRESRLTIGLATAIDILPNRSFGTPVAASRLMGHSGSTSPSIELEATSSVPEILRTGRTLTPSTLRPGDASKNDKVGRKRGQTTRSAKRRKQKQGPADDAKSDEQPFVLKDHHSSAAKRPTGNIKKKSKKSEPQAVDGSQSISHQALNASVAQASIQESTQKESPEDCGDVDTALQQPNTISRKSLKRTLSEVTGSSDDAKVPHSAPHVSPIVNSLQLPSAKLSPGSKKMDIENTAISTADPPSVGHKVQAAAPCIQSTAGEMQHVGAVIPTQRSLTSKNDPQTTSVRSPQMIAPLTQDNLKQIVQDPLAPAAAFRKARLPTTVDSSSVHSAAHSEQLVPEQIDTGRAKFWGAEKVPGLVASTVEVDEPLDLSHAYDDMDTDGQSASDLDDSLADYLSSVDDSGSTPVISPAKHPEDDSHEVKDSQPLSNDAITRLESDSRIPALDISKGGHDMIIKPQISVDTEIPGHISDSSSMKSGDPTSEQDSSDAGSVLGLQDEDLDNVPAEQVTFRDLSRSSPATSQASEPRPELDSQDTLLAIDHEPTAVKGFKGRPALKNRYCSLSSQFESSQRKKMASPMGSARKPSKESDRNTRGSFDVDQSDQDIHCSTSASSTSNSDGEHDLPKEKRASRVKKRYSQGARALLAAISS